jgi:hypothetical protein
LYRRLDGTQSRCGRGEEKNSQSPPKIEPLNPDFPVRSLVVISAELSRLLRGRERLNKFKVQTYFNCSPQALHKSKMMQLDSLFITLRVLILENCTKREANGGGEVKDKWEGDL